MFMKRIATILLAVTLLLFCTSCAQTGSKEENTLKRNLGLNTEVKPATDFTAKTNAAVYDQLDFNDKQEYEFATRGLIDAPETLELKDEDGNIIWSQEAYALLRSAKASIRYGATTRPTSLLSKATQAGASSTH